MAKVKIGIIGCGGIANKKHFPALSAYPDKCEMIAFCDIVEERAKNACNRYGVSGAKVYTDYQELLKDSEIDTVYILTPNVMHSPIAVAAFEAGKNVMCEKPMAHTTEAAQAMLDAWKKSRKKFTIGYQNRFRKDSQCLHAACEAGDLGEIYFAKAHAVRRRAVPSGSVFADKSKQGGGPLIDIGTHALDLALWYMDNYEVESVTGSVFEKLGHSELAVQGNMFGSWDPDTFEVEDSAFGYIKMKNGAAVFLETAWALNIAGSREAACTLCGTKAGAEQIKSNRMREGYDLLFNETTHGELTEQRLSERDSVAFFTEEKNGPEYREASQWLDAILYDKEPLVKPEQAFVVTKILDSVYKSAASGKTIYFD